MKITEQTTAQEIFDVVARHLLTQGRTALNDQGCAYRGDDGCKCAVGCLIDDEDYRPTFEGRRASIVATNLGWPCEHHVLLNGLQSIHDNHAPQHWRVCLENLAKMNGLNRDVLNT